MTRNYRPSGRPSQIQRQPDQPFAYSDTSIVATLCEGRERILGVGRVLWLEKVASLVQVCPSVGTVVVGDIAYVCFDEAVELGLLEEVAA